MEDIFKNRGLSYIRYESNGEHLVECGKCSRHVLVRPERVKDMKGKYCQHCRGTAKKTTEELVQMFTSSGFTLLETPVNTSSKTKVMCEKGHVSYKTYRDCKKAPGCKFCRFNSELSIPEKMERLKENGRSLVIGDLTHHSNTVDIFCSKGHKSTGKLRHFLIKGKGCLECSGKKMKDAEYINSSLERIGIVLVSEYKGTNSNHTHALKHTDCGREWETRFLQSYLRGCASCPLCLRDSKAVNRKDLDHSLSLKSSDWTVESGFKEYETRYEDRVTLIHDACGERKSYLLGTVLSDATMLCDFCDERSSGFNRTIPGMFYYLLVDSPSGPLYKVGITNRSIKDRFCLSDLEKITVLRELWFDKGSSAADLERYYLDLFSEYRYTGAPVLTSGNSELLTKNILGIASSVESQAE